MCIYENQVNELTRKEIADFILDLDDREYDEDTMEGVIEIFLKALKLNDEEMLEYTPVQKLMIDCKRGFSFMPLLNTEARRHKAQDIFQRIEGRSMLWK